MGFPLEDSGFNFLDSMTGGAVMMADRSDLETLRAFIAKIEAEGAAGMKIPPPSVLDLGLSPVGKLVQLTREFQNETLNLREKKVLALDAVRAMAADAYEDPETINAALAEVAEAITGLQKDPDGK